MPALKPAGRRPRRPDLREQVRRTAAQMPSATNAEIAEAVGCHPDTVRKYRGSSPTGSARPDDPQVSLRSVGGKTTGTLLRSAHAADRKQAARRRSTSREALLTLADDPDPDVRDVAVARLADESDPRIHRDLLGDPNCPSALVDRLAGLSFEQTLISIRWKALAHPNCPRERLQAAVAKATGIDPGVALANPALGETLIREYAQAPREDAETPPWQWDYLATNPATPTDVLATIAADPNLNSTVKESLAAHPSCPSDVLGRLAGTPHPKVGSGVHPKIGLAVARNPNCPRASLRALADAFQPKIRKAVAAHDECPSSLLVQLAADPHPGVRRKVLAHEHCPTEAIRQLARFATADDSSTREALARHENCPREVLTQMAQDPDEHVRLQVLINKNCPPDAVRQLADEYAAIAVQHRNCPRDVREAIHARTGLPTADEPPHQRHVSAAHPAVASSQPEGHRHQPRGRGEHHP